MKRIISFTLLTISIICFCVCPAFAENNDSYTNTINDFVTALNQQNMPQVINLFSTEQQEDMTKTFIQNTDNIQNKVGYLNIKSAVISSLQEISKDVYAPFTNMAHYEDQYGDTIKVYLLGKDCTVHLEDKYNYNGVNYSVLVLAEENSSVKIVEDAAVPLQLLDQLLQTRSTPNLQAIQKARNVVYARTMGLVVNDEGTILDINDGEHDIDSTQYVGTNIIDYPIVLNNDYPHTRPSTIKVMLNNGTIKTVDFHLYCKNVLPNEWGPSWPSASLQAGALCVKMVGWWRVENPKYNGYDIKASTADQVYIENSSNAATSGAYNEVTNWGMHVKLSQGGYLFYPAYLSGTAGQIGERSSGTVLQHGTKKLAEEGSSFLSILSYYYDGSSRTYGNDIELFYTT